MAERMDYATKSTADLNDDELNEVFRKMMEQHGARKASQGAKPAFVPSTLTVDQVTAITDTQEAMNRPLQAWVQILAPECGVYNTKYGYLIRECDHVEYEYIGRDDREAATRAKHNLVALLRYKYFKKITDESQARIDKIVEYFCKNLYNNICYVTIDKDDPVKGSLRLDTLPMSAVAFANGVYDFKENRFLVKYERIRVPEIANTLILYNRYLILWYFNYDFTPFPIDINKISFEQFCATMKSQDQDKSTLAWQLFSNMCHDKSDRLTPQRMQHLAEIFGYTIAAPLVQSFVFLIGSGQNGKNSIYDGAFSHFVEPAPGQESIDSIENDRFIGGTLRGISHNICLETVPGIKKSSDQLKKLTGSGEFASEEKGKTKITIPINCKFIFSGNDQNNIKFTDRSHGFDRRCNLFEIHYTWSADHEFMARNPDYYPCDFTLKDIMNDTNNNRIFVYLGMYGIKFATKNFTRDFTFTYNEWNASYADVDADLEDFLETRLTPDLLFREWCDNSLLLDSRAHEYAFVIADPTASSGFSRLPTSSIIQKEYGKVTTQELAARFAQFEELVDYDSDGNEMRAKEMVGVRFFADNDLYISLEYLRGIVKYVNPVFTKTPIDFNNDFRKTANIRNTPRLTANRPYVKARLISGKVRFLDEA